MIQLDERARALDPIAQRAGVRPAHKLGPEPKHRLRERLEQRVAHVVQERRCVGELTLEGKPGGRKSRNASV